MIHDFEEIIFFKPWISENKNYLTENSRTLTSHKIKSEKEHEII